jgi:hypothetical protein
MLRVSDQAAAVVEAQRPALGLAAAQQRLATVVAGAVVA